MQAVAKDTLNEHETRVNALDRVLQQQRQAKEIEKKLDSIDLKREIDLSKIKIPRLPATVPGFVLKKIYFNFSDGPSLGVLEDLADKYTNRKINYKILSNLQRNATIVLTKVGYNSSKAKISYLNEAKGIARITINWGRIDRVLVNNKPINTASERSMIYTALPKLVMGTSYKKKFPGIKYKVLGVIQNTDELAFTLKNSQKSGKTVKLDQGKSHLAAYGFNSLNVLYKKRYMPSLSFSISDSGDNVDVGRLSNNIGLSFGDLLFINDIVSISRNNKIYNSGSQTSDISDTIKYSMIFGY